MSQPPSDKKAFPYYPVLMGVFPVIAVFALNLAMVPVSDIWRPLFIAGVGALVLTAVLSLLYRSVVKGSILAAVIIVAFCSHGPVSRFVLGTALACIDVVVIGLACLALIKTRRDLDTTTRALNFGASVLVILPLAQIVIHRPPGHKAVFLDVKLPVQATAATVRERPDIFFIIVDGYGRSDQLQRVMGYSNESFVSELRNRGFFVEDQSHSTYDQTQLSLTSTLNLSELQDFPRVFPADSDERDPLKVGIDKSFISSYLKRLGYTYVGVTSGFNEVDFRSADLYYDRPLALSMIEDALVQLTPITLVKAPTESLFIDRRESLLGALRNVANLGKPAASPRFVVAHILAPHPPFVFDADGNPVRQHIAFGFWDGSHYMSVGGTQKLYRDGYVGQIQYLNKLLLPVIDALIAKARVRPIIIIEGDHGSKLRLEQDIAKKSDLKEVFGNLMAFYVPPSVQQYLTPKTTSVNTFRAVLDGLFGEKLPMLPDRSFFSPFSMPYRFEDVTSQVADGPK